MSSAFVCLVIFDVGITILVTIGTWNLSCDTPLLWGIVIFTLLFIIFLPSEFPPHGGLLVAQAFFIIPWYLLGQYWIIESVSSCRQINPLLWYWCVGSSNCYILFLLWRCWTAILKRLNQNTNPIAGLQQTVVKEPGNICSICLSEFELGKSLITTQCRHEFHRECLALWIQSNNQNGCPLCRKRLK